MMARVWLWKLSRSIVWGKRSDLKVSRGVNAGSAFDTKTWPFS